MKGISVTFYRPVEVSEAIFETKTIPFAKDVTP